MKEIVQPPLSRSAVKISIPPTLSSAFVVNPTQSGWKWQMTCWWVLILKINCLLGFLYLTNKEGLRGWGMGWTGGWVRLRGGCCTERLPLSRSWSLWGPHLTWPLMDTGQRYPLSLHWNIISPWPPGPHIPAHWSSPISGWISVLGLFSTAILPLGDLF